MPLNTKEDVDRAENSQSGGETAASRVRAEYPFTDDEDDLQSVLNRMGENQAEEAGEIYTQIAQLRQRVDELERRNDAYRDMASELFVAVKAILMQQGLNPDWNPETADVTLDMGAEEGTVDFEDLGDPYDPTKEFE